jgi:hypothetical protein
MAERLPWFRFHTVDWRGDVKLRRCSLAARGLWIDMLAIMHEARPYGHLVTDDEPMTVDDIAVIVGSKKSDVKKALDELIERDVVSQTSSGVMFSKRMVKDRQTQERSSEKGSMGGNPKLIGGYNTPGFVYAIHRASDGHIKIGISNSPAKRLSRLRQKFIGDALTLLETSEVMDMGAEEARLHTMFADVKSGEWFALDVGSQNRLMAEMNRLKVNYQNHLKAHAHDAHLASGLSTSGVVVSNPERARRASMMPPAPKNAVFAGVFVVPDFLDAEFLRKSGWSYDERMAWYAELNREWTGRQIGESDLTFLRKRFEERVGTTSKVPAKSQQTASALQAVLAREVS